MRSRRPNQLQSIVFAAIAGLACLTTLLLLTWRLRRGFDWTDEAFYIATPARFVMGDRPYVDELNVAENAGIFLWPFLKVWHALFGWSGVFAFIRFLYVAFFLGVGGTMYALARTCRLPPAAGILLAAACPCFIPYGLPGLSYNTIGTGLCALGTYTAARALLLESIEEPKIYRDPLVYAGIALGCAAFAYPPFVLTAAATVFGVLVLSTARLRSVLKVCAGGALVGVVLSPLFIRAGVGNLRALMDYSFGGQPAVAGSFVDKLSAAWLQFQQLNPELWKGFAYVGVAVLLAKRAPLVMGLLVPLLPLVVRVPPTDTNAICDYWGCFGTYAPLFALALERRRVGLVLSGVVWLPAVAGAFAVSISSSNGARGAGIGMYAGTIVTALLFALWIEEVARRWSWAFLRPIAQLAPLGFLYVVTQYATADTAVYRDDPLHLLTTRMTSGPYKGLYTTAKRKLWLDKVEADVRAHHKGARTTFYYDFPVGYLYADRPPHLPSTWNFSWLPYRLNIEARWLRERGAAGEHVFRLFGPGHDILDTTLRERGTVVVTGEGYTIWELK